MIINNMDDAEQHLKSVVSKGTKQESDKAWDAVDNYDAMRELMLESGEWYQWCADRGYDKGHTGVDFFA